MTKKKHQHFIPQTYLKRFAHLVDGETYFVDAININTLEITHDLSVKNLCVDCDLYTLKGLPGHQKYSIEDFFNTEIENDYTEVFKLLTDDRIEIISLQQRAKILKTLLSLYFRTPKKLNEFVSQSITLIEDLKSKELKTFNFMGIDIDLSSQSIKEIKQQIREHNREDFIKTNLLIMGEFIKQRAFDGILVMKLTGTDEYITSDNPVLIQNIEGQTIDIFSFENSIFVPLSPSYCVFIAPSIEGAIVNKIYRFEDKFKLHIAIKDSIYKSAERWCIGTRSGIEQFVVDHEKYSKPPEEGNTEIEDTVDGMIAITEITRLVELGGLKKENKELLEYLKNLKEQNVIKENPAVTMALEKFKGLI